MTGAIVVGEALVDLVGVEVDGALHYRPRFGGSPFNVAVGAARLGTAVAFAGPIADDSFGADLVAFARANGVSTTHAHRHHQGTVLAVGRHDGDASRYEYFGDWNSLFLLPALDPALTASAPVVHAGSTAVTDSRPLHTVCELFDTATGTRTLDPNPREALIADLDRYRSGLHDVIELTDIVKVSEEDLAIIVPETEPLAAARSLSGGGRRTVLLSAGSRGAWVVIGDTVAHAPALAVASVDTTGAGDSFMAVVVSAFAAGARPDTVDGWLDLLRRANAAAAWTCLRPGGAEAMPTAHDLEMSADADGRHPRKGSHVR